jgi:hypothetical protein
MKIFLLSLVVVLCAATSSAVYAQGNVVSIIGITPKDEKPFAMNINIDPRKIKDMGNELRVVMTWSIGSSIEESYSKIELSVADGAAKPSGVLNINNPRKVPDGKKTFYLTKGDSIPFTVKVMLYINDKKGDRKVLFQQAVVYDRGKGYLKPVLSPAPNNIVAKTN